MFFRKCFQEMFPKKCFPENVAQNVSGKCFQKWFPQNVSKNVSIFRPTPAQMTFFVLDRLKKCFHFLAKDS